MVSRDAADGQEKEILGVYIQPRSREEALAAIRRLLQDGGSHSVFFVHAATANLAFENPEFRDALNRAGLVLNDGLGMHLAACAAGWRFPDNLVGTDVVPLLLAGPFRVPLRVFLLGARPGVAQRAGRRLAAAFPQVQVAGSHHGYFQTEEEPEVVVKIRRQNPDLLLVGMGNPRQEFFIDRHLQRLNCRVAMGVGGLLDHFAGEIRRAPVWVRRSRLEWLQLVLQQPHKWRRYLGGGPKFLWRSCGRALRNGLFSGLVILAGLAGALAMAEGTVQVWRPQILERYPAGLYAAAPRRQYQLRRDFTGQFRYPEFRTDVRINSQGLRAEQVYGPKPAGVRRVLAVGDSFTMGYSVQHGQTWARRLEELLGPAYEVLNAGVPGYSTWQEIAYLEEEGLGLEPDMVLLAFFMGNDLADNAGPELPVKLQEGKLVAAREPDGLLPRAVRFWLARHSHLYHLVWPAQRALRGKSPGNRDPYPEAGWQATAGLLDRAKRLCRDRQAELFILLIPDRPAYRANPEAHAAHQRMGGVCRDAGVKFLDLSPALSGEGFYYPQDGHWTASGNEAAARAIAGWLQRGT
jgi:N-acetylglucosaminyldiphosphoundecaprenol N-acetyl-beta-D-mannosaminyltransferase